MDKVTSDLMICYYRLSSEDGDVARGNATESFSISAQRLCVRNFLASRPDLEGTVEEIVDDGYTGTNMNRPGMQRLLSLAAAAALALSLVGCGTSAVVPGGSADVVPNPSSTAASVDAPFEMHFIDVGQALSVLVECDGQFMLYDGGNVDDGSLVVSYLQKQGVEELQYVFCSHAHEDHVLSLIHISEPTRH